MKLPWLFAILVLFGSTNLGEAQQPKQQQVKIARVGFLTGSSLSAQWTRNEAFRQSLRDLGYIDGKNVVIDWRSYEGNRDRQRALLGELVRLNVDVIVAVGSGDIRAAKEATSTIPIVMLNG